MFSELVWVILIGVPISSEKAFMALLNPLGKGLEGGPADVHRCVNKI